MKGYSFTLINNLFFNIPFLTFFLFFYLSLLINKDASCSPLDDSLTNIQWLGKMNTSDLEPHLANQINDKENELQAPKDSQVSLDSFLGSTFLSSECTQ